MGDVDDNSLKEEHFVVDSQMKNGRHRVYKFAMDTLDPKYLLEKEIMHLRVSNVQLSWM